MDFCVVMPSVREFPLAYLEPILTDDRHNVQVVVVDDSNGVAPRRPHKKILYVDHGFQDEYFYARHKNKPGLIPRGNPSCKNFGLYYALREGFEVAILLDDDCDTRITPDFLELVPIGKAVLSYTYETNSRWVNTLDNLTDTDGLFARGFPYEERAFPHGIGKSKRACVPMFNAGLWTGTPDINGIDKLKPDGTMKEGITRMRGLKHASILVPFGKNLPLSVMNVQLSTKLIPAFYQPPDFACGDFRVRRHDDVWSMMFLKGLMDLRFEAATFGAPLVWHRKEGDMFKEILAEHATNLIQRVLCNIMQMSVAFMKPTDSYADMAYVAGMEMMRLSNAFMADDFSRIIEQYAIMICQWAEVCGEAQK